VKVFSNYIQELFRFARGKIILNVFLMVVLGTLEGIGILLLIPLLHFAGIGQESSAPLDLILSLPVVLLIYIGLILTQSGLQRYQSNLNTRIQQSFHSFLSIRIFQGLAYAKWGYLAARKKSDLTNILIAELGRVAGGTQFLFQLIAIVIIGVIQIAIAFFLSPILTLVVIGGGLIFSVLMQKHVRQVKEMGATLSKHNRDLFFAITEHLNGIKEVKSCGMEEMHIVKFIELRKNIENNFVQFNRIQSGTQMLYKAGAAVFISIFFYGMVNFFHTQPEEILLIVVIFARLWPRFSSFQGGLQHVAMMLPAFLGVMDFERECMKEKEIYLKGQSLIQKDLQEGIEFKNVFFSYNSNSENPIYAVKNLSFTIPNGSTTALVGVSGSGKSTVADLITGILTPQQGLILVDRVPLKDINVHLWRKNIGYVPQDAFLFNASLRDNMLWSHPSAKEKEIWQALKLAAIDDFISRLPEGLDTRVGDRGVRLSGGERQRIVLARALLRKPALLILDEATNSLDGENEKRIQKAIESLHGKLTILIITHRLSTIKNADQIIVLDQGTVKEIRDYEDLTLNLK
jgi:ATP-binding cassette subfamily C protein